MKNVLFFALVTFLSTGISAQISYNFLENQTRKSDIVVIGKVYEKESFWGADKTTIFTSNKILIDGSIKGEPLQTLEIITNGGDLDGKFQIWSEEPTLKLGSEGYFFLIEDKSKIARQNLCYRLNGLDGFINISDKQNVSKTYKNKKTSSAAKVVEFEFDNIQVEQGNIISFDIVIKTNSEGAGFEYGYGDILAQYSENVFGTNVYANGRLAVSKGIVIGNPVYTLSTEDFTTDVFKSVISSACNLSTSFQSGSGIPLTTSFQQLLSIRLEVQDVTAIGTISLDEFQMDGKIHYFDPLVGLCLPFDEIIYPDPIETNLLCSITSFSSDFDEDNPDRTTAGTDNVLTITGMNFGNNPGSVEFQNADDVIPPIDLVSTEVEDFTSGLWTDNLIQVKVPSAPVPAGSGIFQIRTPDGKLCISDTPLEICYGMTNIRFATSNEVHKIYLADYPNDTNGQFVFRLEDDIQTNADAVNAIQMALCDWNRATGIDWILGDEYNNEDLITGLDASPAIDNVNHIFMADSIVFTGNPNAKMRTIIGGERIDNCSDFSELPPLPIFYTTDIDIAVREDLAQMEFPALGGWNFDTMENPESNQADFYSVILHELGHAHLLTHALPNDKLMYPASDFGTIMRQVTNKEVLGGNYILDIAQSILNSPDADSCPSPRGRNEALCTTNTTDGFYAANQVNIFPNPYSNQFIINLSLENTHNVRVNVHDMLGQEIFTKHFGTLSASEHTLDITTQSNIPTGVYFVEIDIDGFLKVFKLMKK